MSLFKILDSTMFRHSLRLTIAIVFAYLLGFLLTSKHLLDFADRHCYYATYGLTKERRKIVSSALIGAAVAVGIVLLTQNVVVYAVLAFVSLYSHLH
jgi:hypothetical protein